MKTKSKKILALLLLVMIFTTVALTGCGKSKTTPTASGDRYDSESAYADLSVRESTGTHGAVASASAYASKAGYDILRKGGNAFDAAVAIAFAIGVTEPFASGIGGGGVMTAYDAKTKQYHYYNFREFLPQAATYERYQQIGRVPKIGMHSVGVPTEVAGLCAISEDFGKLSLKEVVQPAISLAENGFTISRAFADAIALGFANFPLTNLDGDVKPSNDEAMGIYGDEYGIDSLKEGDKLVQKNYANVLKAIANDGAAGFYTGWVANAILEANNELNGLITQDDLIYAMNNYPKKGEPLHTNVFGYDIYTSSTPSSGGIILIEALNMLEHYNANLSTLDRTGADYLHAVNTALQLAYADKRKYVADNHINPITGQPFVDVPIEGLANKEYAAQRFDAIYNPNDVFVATSSYDWGGANRAGKMFGSRSYQNDNSPFNYQSSGASTAEAIDVDDSGTTSFSVADSEGNIVSFTQTLNHFWGSYVMPKDTGFFLNDQLTSFQLKETSAQSVHYIAPYKQPVSHIMPTIILKDGKPFATLGSPGSMRIPAAVLQVALNMMVFDMDVQSAINADRTFNYAVSSKDSNEMPEGYSHTTHKLLYLETSNIPAEVVEALRAKGYYIHENTSIDLFYGGVQGIKYAYNADGTLKSITGGADPRRDGKALAY